MTSSLPMIPEVAGLEVVEVAEVAEAARESRTSSHVVLFVSPETHFGLEFRPTCTGISAMISPLVLLGFTHFYFVRRRAECEIIIKFKPSAGDLKIEA